ncbi:energy-coupling factor transporter transmembrane component T family protein [Hoyosella altamirensis]|uniref:energy-coupling factor transporter transmembrane component T family protein n=1 Tax=Hoyosella altamirensis TaxID=616997 RepID=UPI0009FBC842|nr:energy-coupling factor transporter transmembrane component T [Hoyosella altamirensis]
MRLYSPGRSWLHRRNPLAKLVAVICLALLVFAVPAWWWLVVPLGALLTLSVTVHNTRQILKWWAGLVLPFAVLSFLLQGLFFPEGETLLAGFGPARLTVEGLEFAALYALRIATILAAFVLFTATTAPSRLMTSLTTAGLNPKISYMVTSGIALIPALNDRAQSVLAAQRARGLQTTGNLAHRTRVLLTVVKPVVFGVLADLEQRAFTLEQRGFGSQVRPTAYSPAPFSAAERAFCVLAPIVTLTFVLVLLTVGRS